MSCGREQKFYRRWDGPAHPLIGNPLMYCSSLTLQYASLSLGTRLPCFPLAIGSLIFSLPHRLHLGFFLVPSFFLSLSLAGGRFTCDFGQLGLGSVLGLGSGSGSRVSSSTASPGTYPLPLTLATFGCFRDGTFAPIVCTGGTATRAPPPRPPLLPRAPTTP